MYESLDLYFSDQGDFIIGPDGDLFDTVDDSHRSLYQEIITLSTSNYNDFALHPTLGANLQEFTGARNNAQTGALIRERLQQTLTDFLLLEGTYQIEVVPISPDQVSVLLQVQTGALIEEPLTCTLTLNLTDASLTPLLPPA